MTKKDIGELISKELRERKVSYYAIGEGAKVQRHIVKAMESGETAYTIDSLGRVLDFLGMEIDIKQKKKEYAKIILEKD